MEHIICPLAVIPIRKEANHRSEQVSQLVFGETAVILQQQSGWILVETVFDHYKGWIEEHVAEIIENQKSGKNCFIVNEPLITVFLKGVEMHLPAGSEISETIGNSMQTRNGEKLNLNDISGIGKNTLTETARKFLRSPYLWGGRTCLGMDCSGFTQIVFKINGITLPRDAKDQALTGREITSMEEAVTNDLIFFGERMERITHVGIYLGNHEIIHASKSVRIDQVDAKGIYTIEHSCYTHKLQSIRRIL